MRIPPQPAAHGADRFMTRAGARLRYRDEGRGPVLVLIHGWALDLELFDPQVARLARRFRIVRMDRRGFGLSSGTPSLEADARDVRALLDLLGVQRAAVLGMSQGTRVALNLATSCDGRVTCLILDGAPGDARLASPRFQEELPWTQYQRKLREHGLDALRRAIAAHPVMQPHTRAARRRAAAIFARYPGRDLRVSGAREESVSGVPLSRLSIPVLIVNGERDTPQRLRVGEALQAAIPRAERHVVRRAGHLANLDNPRQYNAVLGRFLERHLAADRQRREKP